MDVIILKIKELVPVSLKTYYRLLKCKKRFPQASYIRTDRIGQNVKIGNYVGIGEDVILDSNVEIGDYSYINKGAIVFAGTIGKFCSIAHYCQIGLPIHPIKYVSTNPNTYGNGNIFEFKSEWNDILKPPIIGNDVWIGSHAMIMQNVNIGDGAIIGAGAVVTKDVKPYTIVGGIPAKPIGKRFEEEKIEYLLNLKWWNLSIEEIKKLDLFNHNENWFNSIGL